jgi:hypothetical protein
VQVTTIVASIEYKLSQARRVYAKWQSNISKFSGYNFIEVVKLDFSCFSNYYNKTIKF